jgi:putative phage-type endonuclease
VSDIEQGTDAWLRQRLGRVTASCVADVMAKTKTGWAATRLAYRSRLVIERLTGEPLDTYLNDDMRRGIEMEPEARGAYEFYQGCTVQQVGFVPHPTIPMAGCSPDGLVGEDGLVEFKCPRSNTHLETLLGREIPGKYQLQMMFQMACTGRRWADFVSYDPRFPEEMRLFVKRIERDDARIKDICDHVECFLQEIDATVAELTKLYRQQEAA